jgi:hypothetical protein
VKGKQYVAYVSGTRSPIFPVPPSTARIVMFRLP